MIWIDVAFPSIFMVIQLVVLAWVFVSIIPLIEGRRLRKTGYALVVAASFLIQDAATPEVALASGPQKPDEVRFQMRFWFQPSFPLSAKYFQAANGDDVWVNPVSGKVYLNTMLKNRFDMWREVVVPDLTEASGGDLR